VHQHVAEVLQGQSNRPIFRKDVECGGNLHGPANLHQGYGERDDYRQTSQKTRGKPVED
jgi:hypothetical protein